MNSKVTQILHDGWEFQRFNTDSWHSATVPGCVHLDLIANDLIPDPFFGLNESQLQWISNKSWTYRLAFQPSSKVLSKKNIEILFHGLDTYADVYLNGKTVLCANNMFHPWNADIKDIINAGHNELLVQFRSPLKEVVEKMKSMDYTLPADNDQAGKTSLIPGKHLITTVGTGVRAL